MRNHVRSAYHVRWVWDAIRAAPFMAGGPWGLVAAVAIGAVVAVLSAPAGEDAMTFGIEAFWHGIVATLLVLCILVVVQLVVAPRRMEISARAESEALEHDLRDQVASLVPAEDAELTVDALSVRPYVEPSLIIGPGEAGSVLGVEYTNRTASALEKCAVMWEGLESPTNFGWTRVGLFLRHRLTWDDTGEHEIRIAAGQSRRVELVICWPGGAVAILRIPGESGDGRILPEGTYQVTLGVVVDGHQPRKEHYHFYWGNGQLSVDQPRDLLT